MTTPIAYMAPGLYPTGSWAPGAAPMAGAGAWPTHGGPTSFVPVVAYVPWPMGAPAPWSALNHVPPPPAAVVSNPATHRAAAPSNGVSATTVPVHVSPAAHAQAEPSPSRGTLRAGPRPEGIIRLEAAVLHKNDTLAESNRTDFLDRRIAALNVMSSPGSGKTTLLVRTIQDLAEEVPFFVLEGDQETAFDAERIRATGVKALQINTGKGCHLEADMIAQGVRALDPRQGVLLIENVGNLVCPALFDLGENARVVLFSVTEGEDKPRKYPHMFQAADLVVITKIDLIPHLDFDRRRSIESIREIAPDAEIIELSSRTGEGLERWYEYLRSVVPN